MKTDTDTDMDTDMDTNHDPPPYDDREPGSEG